MIKRILTLMCVFSALMASAQTGWKVVSEGLRFCESTYPYEGGILIANFGTEQLNPLNTEGKGYIVHYKNGKSEVMVPADGNLSAPKGMFIRDSYLYVCDVNKVVVYNLKDVQKAPVVETFPEGNLFVNDLVAEGNWLYASVTNTGKIFRMDISRPEAPGKPEEWAEVAGPNGLLMQGGKMYVASYPADGVTKKENVVYCIADLQRPVPQRVTEVAGQYDGLALAADGSLYVTNWVPAQLARLNLTDGTIVPFELSLPDPLVGPADITVSGGCIYIPDLPNSRVIIINE